MSRFIIAAAVASIFAVAVAAAPAITAARNGAPAMMQLDMAGRLLVKCVAQPPPDAGSLILAIDEGARHMVCAPDGRWFDGGVR